MYPTKMHYDEKNSTHVIVRLQACWVAMIYRSYLSNLTSKEIN